MRLSDQIYQDIIQCGLQKTIHTWVIDRMTQPQDQVVQKRLIPPYYSGESKYWYAGYFSYIGRVLNRSNIQHYLTNKNAVFSLKIHSCLKYHPWQYFLHHLWISEFRCMICRVSRTFRPWWIVEELAPFSCWWPRACWWPCWLIRVRQRRLRERQGSQPLLQLQGCRRHHSDKRKTCSRVCHNAYVILIRVVTLMSPFD